jgi:hypothetical protein
MFQILIIMRVVGSLEGGRAAAMQVLQFDSMPAANVAYKKLQEARILDSTIVALY